MSASMASSNDSNLCSSMASSTVSNFISDMCYEFLTRTSLETLDRCKLASKAWNNLTSESNFTSLHCKRTNTISGYIVQNKAFSKPWSTFVSINKYDRSISDSFLNFLPEKVNILAASNHGILCCMNRYGDKYYVCKPRTKQFEVMPTPNMELQSDAFALVVLQSNPLRYRIVRLSSPKELSMRYYNYGCQIFDSQTWRWKDSKDILLPSKVLLKTNYPIVLGSSIHLLTTNNCVLKFNADKEIYTTFSLPKPLYDDDNGDIYQHKKLVEYKGQLGVVCELAPNSDDLGLWVLKDLKKKVWDEGRVLKVNGDVKRDVEPLASMVALHNADIAVMRGVNSTIFYNFRTCKFEVVKLDCFTRSLGVLPFRSDLELVDLKK